MPQWKNVQSLQGLSINCFSLTISRSISSLINGSYNPVDKAPDKKIQNKGSTKSKRPPVPRSGLVIPTKEVQKMKKFVADNIPKALRSELFHLVLRKVTDILLTNPQKPKKGKKLTPLTFSERVSQLDKGFVYVFNMLMCKEITHLDFTAVLHMTMKWVDGCRLSNTDPKETDLNYSRIEMIFLKNFAENTKLMTNLVALVWPHLISGDLVRVVGKHLQNLKELILACSCETGPFIEEERKGPGIKGSQSDLISSMRSLFQRSPGDFTMKNTYGCPKLKKLILPNLEDEDGEAAAIVAEALKHLSSIEVVSGVSTLVSLMKIKEMYKSELPPSFPLKTLNDYDPFKQRSMTEVEFIKPLLPKLESIELRVSEDLTLRIINQFYDIRELSIDCSSFHTIVKKFSSLTYLNISLDFNCPWPLLLSLGKNCKNLKYLTIEHSSFKMDQKSLEEMKYPIMTNLIYVKLIRSSFIEFVALSSLIKGCSQLQELYITLSNDRNYSVDEFADSLIRTIAPQLSNLEKFTAECLYKFNLYLHLNCILTIASARVLISHCPKLKFIGHLDSWDVKDTDIKDLLKDICVNNWDLELA